MKNKYLVVLCFMVSVLCVSACSATSPEAEVQSQSSSATIPTEDEGYIDDIVQHFDPAAIEGSYTDTVSQRATMEIVYNDLEEYYEVLIHWANSARDTAQWSMFAYDEGTVYLNYANCECVNIHYTENGDEEIEEVYESGSGSLLVNEDATITWKDDEGEEHIFEKM